MKSNITYKILFFAITFIGFTSVLKAQTIQGTLKNIDNQPFSFVTIKINNSHTKTDSIGHIQLRAPGAGTYTLSTVLVDRSELKLSTFTITSAEISAPF